MRSSSISRRNFIIAGSALLAAPLAKAQQTPAQFTAGQLVERIRNHVGVPWAATTVDRILAGNAETVIQGIAVTMMATLDVSPKAKNVKNLPIMTKSGAPGEWGTCSLQQQGTNSPQSQKLPLDSSDRA